MFTHSAKSDDHKGLNLSKQESVSSQEQSNVEEKFKEEQKHRFNPGTPLTPSHIMQLQKNIGNQAVLQLLKAQSKAVIPPVIPAANAEEQTEAVSGDSIVQLKPGKFNNYIPNHLKSGKFELFTTWVKIEKKMNEYRILGDEEYSKRHTVIQEMNQFVQTWIQDYAVIRSKLTAQEKLPSELDKSRSEFLLLLEPDIAAEVKEITSVKGGLKQAAGNVASDPIFTSKIGKGGGVFKEKSDIVDDKEKKLGEGEEGKAFRIIDSWSDSELVVKNNTYQKVTKEDADKAGSNYQEIPDGFVKKDKIIITNRITKKAGLKYLNQNDPLLFPLFPHIPSKKDVVQGALADCYLLAAVNSILTKTPEHFINHMVDHGDGKITVKLYKGIADPINITVNKSIVVNEADQSSAYASGGLWVAILEKAYTAAGFYGSSIATLPVKEKSFGMAEGGDGSVALTHLLGVDTDEMLIAHERNEVSTIAFDKMEPIMNIFTKKVAADPEDAKSFEQMSKLQTFVGDLDTLTSAVYFDSNSLEELLTKHQISKGTEVYTIIKETLLSAENRLLTGPVGSGAYGSAEMELFNAVKTKIDAGKLLIIGSKEKIYDDESEISGKGHSGGEPKVKGLVGNHAYSVIDYAPKNPQEGQTLSIKLRNPWSKYGRKYQVEEKDIDISTGAVWKGTPLADEGAAEFWIDISEIVAYFSKLYFTK